MKKSCFMWAPIKIPIHLPNLQYILRNYVAFFDLSDQFISSDGEGDPLCGCANYAALRTALQA